MSETPSLIAMSTTLGRRHLFVDLLDVEGLDHVRQSVCEARKHPLNPLLRVGMPHEPDGGRCSPWPTRSVLHDARDERFRG